MAARFVNIDYDTPLILPPNLRDWVPAGHLAHFILDAVEEMDLRQIRVNDRGTGGQQYPPRAEIEARAQGRYALDLAEHEKKLAERAAKKERGERIGGKPPQAPTPEPSPKDQYNFTDPESRIMKAGSGPHFEQCYNAQAAVEVDSPWIVGERVSQAPHDKQELVPTVANVVAPADSVAAVLVDSGFYSEAAVVAVEQTSAGQPTGTTVYAALEKKAHHRTVSDLEKKEEPAAPAPGAPLSEVRKHRLKTAAGKAQYKLRQHTVAPVFGIIKSVMGFRQFLLRGLEKVGLEWQWVCLAYNLKRLHIMTAGLKRAGQA